MTVSAEDVARRVSQDRPGFTLLHFEEVALPFFRVILDSVIQRKKDVPPIEEFVLRAVAADLNTVEDIQGFLGLDRALVEAAIASQWQADSIDYGTLPGDPIQRVRLSARGKEALEGLQTMTPERMELVVDFDRLSWRVTRLASPAPLRPRDIKQLGLREIPARQARRPELDDLPVDDLAALMRQAAGARTADADLLSVRNIVRAERIYEMAVMLVYGTSGSEAEVAFAIDGRLSREHEQALAAMGGAKRLSLEVADTPPEPVAIDEDLLVLAAPSDQVEELQKRVVTAETRLERLRAITTATETDDATDPPTLGQSKRELEDELRQAREALEALAIRRVQVHEHPIFLREALTRTQQRLLIISPWITGAVVNSAFLSDLDRLCRRGIRIHIGYGIDDAGPQFPRDKQAERQLVALANKHENFTFRRLGNTHAKILIWDQKWITTSFNWLSFRGDPHRTFRQEEGILVVVPKEVEQSYEQYVAQIESEE